MTYSLILFDLDGTITDSKLGITKSVQYSLSKFGISESLDVLTKFIGPPLQVSFKEFYPEIDVDLAIKYHREYFAEKGLFENKVYLGIPELLSELVSKNKKLVVATSKPTPYSKKIVKFFKLDKYFADVIGSNLDGTRIHKTEIIAEALSRFKFSNSQAIMVGDRKHDIIGANNNKIDSIFVEYGYAPKKEIEESSATHVCKTVADLKELLI